MSKRTLYAFIVSFVLLITVIALNRFTFNSMKRFATSVDEAREIITTFESLSNNFKSAQIYTPTYARDSLRNYYELYKKEADSVLPELDRLRQLVKNNPLQKELVTQLNTHIRIHMNALMNNNVAELIQKGESWRLNELFIIHRTINQGIENEKAALVERKSELESVTGLNNLLTTAFGVVAVGLIVLTFLSNFFISRHHKWLEGFLASILNTSQNGIAHYKAIRQKGKIVDFKIAFVNRAVDHLLNLSSTDFIGKRLSSFPSYISQAGLMDRLVEVVESGKPVEFEHKYVGGGRERWLLISLARMDDGVIASLNNITQLKEYEEELKEKINELERSNTELEQYAYIASHDLQEPLRKIRSFGTFLQDTQGDRLDARGREQLRKMLLSAERMSTLIRDILSYSGLDRQEAYEPTDLNQILQSVLQDLDLLITQKKARVESDQLPTLDAIPLQMTQLFFNLLSNSLKFSREDRPPHIRIECRRVEENEKDGSHLPNITYWELRFADNGIGFNQDYAEQIFGLFKRLNEKQVYPGSGIGLALCKKVVDNHHGTISAIGSEQEGATFVIQLPAQQRRVLRK